MPSYTVTCKTADGVERTVEVTEGANVCPIYNYHKTGRYLVSKTEAKPFPLAGPNYYVAPAHATPVAPPERELGKIRVFDPDTQTWSQVVDHTTVSYWSTQESSLAQSVTISDPVSEPVGVTTVQPCSYNATTEHLCWNADTCTWCAEANVVLTAEEKLEKAGLSVEELRGLLGL